MRKIICFFLIVILGIGWTLAQAQKDKKGTSSLTADAKSVWAGMAVSNLDSSIRWYQDMLGFSVTKQMNLPDHKLRIAFLDQNGFTLELIEFSDSVSFSEVRERLPRLKDRDHLQGFVKLGFQISDVAALASRLKSNGVKLRMEPTDDREFHDRFFLLEDPDGNTLQFFQRKD